MAYFRTIVQGSLGSVERWSVGVNWGIFGISGDNPEQALVDDMLAQLIAWTTNPNVPNTLRALLSNQASIDGWRVEKRSEDEKILSVSQGILAAQVLGTGTPSKTPQDAIVVSLRTSTPGPTGRGRIYWPALGAALNASFQLSAPTAPAIAGDARTFLRGIGDRLNQALINQGSVQRVVLSVRSAKNHVSRDVNLLQVGSVLDTQRRRRDALPESYAPLAYPGS